MKIYLATDHAGFELKEFIKTQVNNNWKPIIPKTINYKILPTGEMINLH